MKKRLLFLFIAMLISVTLIGSTLLSNVSSCGNDPCTKLCGGGVCKGIAGKVDVICGSNLNDTIYAYDKNDKACGWYGNDTIYGGAGNDQLWGGPGVDALYGGDGTDLLDGGPGRDACIDVLGTAYYNCP